MTQPVCYVIGGKLGDLYHSMYVIKSIWEDLGFQGVLVMSDRFGGDTFSHANTYNELCDLIKHQEYIQDFVLDDGTWQPPENTINLNAWRSSPLLGHTNWTEFLTQTFSLKRRDPCHGWLQALNPYEGDILPGVSVKDTILIHQSYRTRIDPSFPWGNILTKNKNCLFITCNINEYEDFSHKHLVSVLLVNNITQLAAVISSCKLFIGNMSSPLALAVALGKTCYAQLFCVDRASYIGIASNMYYESRVPEGLQI